MLTVGLILLLCPVQLVKTESEFQLDNLVFIDEGKSVNITCPYQSDISMHFSWYKHKFGQKPVLVSSFYKYAEEATFYHEYKENVRFRLIIENGKTHMEIKELQVSDSATYYCGTAHSNIVEFGDGTKLIVQASQMHRVSVRHQSVLSPVHPGDSVTLNCTVITDHCSEEQNVYWFKYNTGESLSGIIYTHKDNSGFCNKKPRSNSLTQSCNYLLPKMNLTAADAGTYYCAVALCEEILFGSGTTLEITGLGFSGHVHTLVIFSILRCFVLFCCIIVIMIYICIVKTYI